MELPIFSTLRQFPENTIEWSDQKKGSRERALISKAVNFPGKCTGEIRAKQRKSSRNSYCGHAKSLAEYLSV